jgi:hypothetical protein
VLACLPAYLLFSLFSFPLLKRGKKRAGRQTRQAGWPRRLGRQASKSRDSIHFKFDIYFFVSQISKEANFLSQIEFFFT